MRHQIKGYRLNRNMGHRTSMRRTMIKQLFEHEKIKTTLAKAKSIQPDAEKLITLAKSSTKQKAQEGRELIGDAESIEHYSNIMSGVVKLTKVMADGYAVLKEGEWVQVRIPLKAFIDDGVYWDSKAGREISSKMDWSKIQELRISIGKDENKVGAGKPGPVTRRLQELFFGLFNGNTADKYGWLERV